MHVFFVFSALAHQTADPHIPVRLRLFHTEAAFLRIKSEIFRLVRRCDQCDAPSVAVQIQDILHRFCSDSPLLIFRSDA